MQQRKLIEPEHLPLRLRWEKLFEFLPPWPPAPAKTGRRPVDRFSLLKACIYQRLTRKRFLRDLHTHLLESPPLLAALGFDPFQSPPSLERFSAFLADCPHQRLQQIRIQLTRELISLGVIKGVHLGLDSCPVASWVRENNLKTSLRNRRWDKTSLPKGDPDARLGVRIHYPNPNQSQVEYFWGYRNHTLADLPSELPVWERTEPNSVSECTLAIPLLKAGIETFHLPVDSVCADAEYDVEALLRYIIHQLKARPFIPRNLRSTQDKRGFRRAAQQVFCPADLPMYRHGRMTVKGISYIQYRCPFFDGPKPALLICPAAHPKFTQQKGCNYLWRLTDNPRDQIPYGTQLYKDHYHRRTAIERTFSRLLAITLQEPSVRGLASIKNHCTISHIAVLLVASAAHQLGHTNKTRFVRTFVPHFLESN
jgi:hypothetical protein